MDDIPGRIIGKEVGIKAFDFAKSFFEKSNEKLIEVKIFPNPVNRLEQLVLTNTSPNLNFQLFDINGKNIPIKFRYNLENNQTNINFNGHLVPGLYILRSNNNVWKLIVN
jgi:hypothetical protein